MSYSGEKVRFVVAGNAKPDRESAGPKVEKEPWQGAGPPDDDVERSTPEQDASSDRLGPALNLPQRSWPETPERTGAWAEGARPPAIVGVGDPTPSGIRYTPPNPFGEYHELRFHASEDAGVRAVDRQSGQEYDPTQH